MTGGLGAARREKQARNKLTGNVCPELISCFVNVHTTKVARRNKGLS